MRILRWLEDRLDNITPKTAVIGCSQAQYRQSDLEAIANRLMSELGVTLRDRTDTSCVFGVRGKTMSDLGGAMKVSLGGDPIPEMYASMKSRLRVSLVSDGTIEVESYEHLAGPEREREAFKAILARRLAAALELIDATAPW